MKAKEVLRLLRISRQTLTKYVKDGLIEVETLPNGRYEYNEKKCIQISKQRPETENLHLCKSFHF